MGGSEEQTIMVAGLAGGMGLGGNGCGALGAAVWMNTLNFCKQNTEGCNAETKESPIENPNAAKTLKAYTDATHSEFLCHRICGQRFQNLADHTEYIEKGGCEKLIDTLAGV